MYQSLNRMMTLSRYINSFLHQLLFSKYNNNVNLRIPRQLQVADKVILIQRMNPYRTPLQERELTVTAENLAALNCESFLFVYSSVAHKDFPSGIANALRHG